MRVETHGFEEALDPRRVDLAAAQVTRRAEDIDSVTLVIARDFPAAVRHYSEGKNDDYDSDRMFGWAAGKTLQRSDGQAVVILDGAVVTACDVTDSQLERLAAHEGLHVAIDQRGESTGELRAQENLSAWSAAGIFGDLCGILLEEYRIERALADEGMWPSPPAEAGLDVTCALCLQAFLDASDARGAGGSVEDYLAAVGTAVHRLTVKFAYLAGQELGRRREGIT